MLVFSAYHGIVRSSACRTRVGDRHTQIEGARPRRGVTPPSERARVLSHALLPGLCAGVNAN
eukprot:scaffold52991_cov63-Phaeocystis_antarctica.AAC.2